MTRRVFVVGNRAGVHNQDSGAKITGYRKYKDIEIVSIVLEGNINFEQLVMKLADSSADIFVDAEKKACFEGGKLNINLLKTIRETTAKLGMESKIRIFPIKLNDITVRAIVDVVNQDFREISGLNIGILGLGNVGFKTAMTLTEFGCRTKIYNRTIEKIGLANESITRFKPKNTISSPVSCSMPEHIFSGTQASIISASQFDLDLDKIEEIIDKEHRIYLVGHSVLKGEIKKMDNRKIKLRRLDVSKVLIGEIAGTIFSCEYNNYGQKLVNGLGKICSGGYLGEKGTLIVDNIEKPNIIIGRCDGQGGLVREKISTEIKENRLKEISEILGTDLFG